MKLEVVFQKENKPNFLVREWVEILNCHYDEETNTLLMQAVSLPKDLYLSKHNVVKTNNKQVHMIGYGVRRLTSGFGQVVLTGVLRDDKENKIEFQLS
ncbi:MAG: hypothetical protein Q8P07_01070 [bacterium]|nr:hypothetical protein [bacterium]